MLHVNLILATSRDDDIALLAEIMIGNCVVQLARLDASLELTGAKKRIVR